MSEALIFLPGTVFYIFNASPHLVLATTLESLTLCLKG